MWTKNFIKELVLKNDLTYLTLCFPYLVSLTLKPEGLYPFLTLIGLFGVLIFAWVMSFRKRYIFNTPMKSLFPISCLLFVCQFFGNETLVMIASFLSMMFVAVVFCFIVTISYMLYSNASEHYESEYDPSLTDLYHKFDYLRSIYSLMNYNNTFKYFYDANIDVYVYNDCLYENLTTNDQKARKIAFLTDYIFFLKQNDLKPKTMTKENFSVFKMFLI